MACIVKLLFWQQAISCHQTQSKGGDPHPVTAGGLQSADSGIKLSKARVERMGVEEDFGAALIILIVAKFCSCEFCYRNRKRERREVDQIRRFLPRCGS